MMMEKIHEKGGVFVPQNSHFSCFVSITFPLPTIRIKTPKVLVKAMQRRNQTQTENDEENGSKNKEKYWATSNMSFRKKVGSIFSNVLGFGKKKLVPETDSRGENGEVHINGGDDEEMKKLKNMIERADMESEKLTRKDSEDKLNDGIQQQMAETKKGANNTFGTKGIVSLKKAGNFKDLLARFRSKTASSHWKLKTAWWMKKKTSVEMGLGESEKQELWKKRILMGGKCRPLNDSGI